MSLDSGLSTEMLALLHFRTPPPCPIVIDDSSWKNAAESFTVALTLTLGGYESAIAPKCLGAKIGKTKIWENKKQKILGLEIDRTLSFDEHIASSLCTSQSRKEIRYLF